MFEVVCLLDRTVLLHGPVRETAFQTRRSEHIRVISGGTANVREVVVEHGVNRSPHNVEQYATHHNVVELYPCRQVADTFNNWSRSRGTCSGESPIHSTVIKSWAL